MRRILFACALLLIAAAACASTAHSASAWQLACTIRADDWGSGPIALSPDGRFLACYLVDHIAIRDTRTGLVKTRIANSQRPYTGAFLRLFYSPDGKTLALAGGYAAFSANSRVLLGSAATWNASTGQRFQFADGNPKYVQAAPTRKSRVISASFSPDGKYLATGTSGGLILWDAATHSIRRIFVRPESARVGGTLAALGNVTAVVFSPDSRILVSQDGAIREWDVTTGKLLKTIEARDSVQAIAFRPDGRALIAAYRRDIAVLAVPSGRRVATLIGHTGDVRSLAISPDGQTLWSLAIDGAIIRWNLPRGTRTVTYGHFQALTVSADGSALAYTIGDNQIFVRNLLTGKVRRRLTGLTAPLVYDVAEPEAHDTLALSPTGTLLAEGAYTDWSGMGGDGGLINSELALWNMRGSKPPRVWKEEVSGDLEPAEWLEFSPNGGILVESSMDEPNGDAEFRLRAMPRGKIIRRWFARPVNAQVGADTPGYDGRALIFLSNHAFLIGSLFDNGAEHLAVWDVATGRVTGSLQDSVGLYDAVEGGGALIVASRRSEDGRQHFLEAWNARSRRRLWSVPVTDRIFGVSHIAVSADGRWVCYASSIKDSPFILRDGKTSRIFLSFGSQAGIVNSLAITNQGKEIVAASDDCVRVRRSPNRN